jgi:hypothetical protein
MLMPKLRMVFQGDEDSCGIACAAMITGSPYLEALRRLWPPPVSPEVTAAYSERERAFLHEKGWWESAQLLLTTARDISQIDACIESEDRFQNTVEASQRLRLILAFADGSKPDHSAVWDRNYKNVVLDPARGIIRLTELFENVGAQSYSGVLGFTSFCFQPGQPIQTLIKTEAGFDL